MQIDVIETTSLGDRSYLISEAGTGVVVDPQRDIDRVLDLVARRGVTVTHVLETHVHNDYVTGGLELARATGAAYLVPAGDDVAYERVPAVDGHVHRAGPLRITVLHTPGHTHHHVAYAVARVDGEVEAVFTGGSMLYGSTGRTDLLGAEHTDTLTHASTGRSAGWPTSSPPGPRCSPVTASAASAPPPPPAARPPPSPNSGP